MTATYGWNRKQPLWCIDQPGGGNRFSVFTVHEQTMVVGADTVTSDSGSAYVYTYDVPSKNWIDYQILHSHDRAVDDYFGSAVSLNKNYILVGARGADPSGSNSGAAYIFTNSSGVWYEHQKIAAPDGNNDNYFGGVVSVHPTDNILAVSSNCAWGAGAGFVYVYTASLDDGRFYCNQKITKVSGSDGWSVDHGFNMQLSGSWLFIFHKGYPDFVNPWGAIWVFHNNGSNTFVHNQSILGTDMYPGCRVNPKRFFVGNDYLMIPSDMYIADVIAGNGHAVQVYKNNGGLWQKHSTIDNTENGPNPGVNHTEYNDLTCCLYKPLDFSTENDLFAAIGYRFADPGEFNPFPLNSGYIGVYRYNTYAGKWQSKLILTGNNNLQSYGLNTIILSGSNKTSDIDVMFGSHESVDDLNLIYGITASFYDSVLCGTPLIGPDHTLNHYICLPTNYNSTFNERVATVPFSLKYRPHFHISGSKML